VAPHLAMVGTVSLARRLPLAPASGSTFAPQPCGPKLNWQQEQVARLCAGMRRDAPMYVRLPRKRRFCRRHDHPAFLRLRAGRGLEGEEGAEPADVPCKFGEAVAPLAAGHRLTHT
jgi:hypothetical protein